jgi:acetoacetyl-CoA synthetase
VKPPRYSDPTENVVLFIKCTSAASSGTLTPSPKVTKQLNDAIAKDLTRRHVPAYIFETPEVPYNANGKKLEIQLKAVLCGGHEALDKLKVTKEERDMLSWFVKFYDVEKVVKEQHGRMAKL